MGPPDDRQAKLVHHIGMDRSASYNSALETARSSPTLLELEQLARYFRVPLLDFLAEAMSDSERRGASVETPEADDRVPRLFAALSPTDQDFAVEMLQLLARHRSPRRTPTWAQPSTQNSVGMERSET